MVYRVQRAKKILFAKIFLVVIIYSLLIGISGLLMLGFVINFDQQSFNPSLYDASTSGSNKLMVCNSYGSATCPWLLYNDLIAQNQSNPYFSNSKSSIINLKNEALSQNLLLLNDNSTNSIMLGQIYFHEDGLFLGTSDFLSRINNPNNFISDSPVNLDYYCGSSNSCSLYFQNSLSPYSIFTYTNNNSLFYGTKVLLSGMPSDLTNTTDLQSLVICGNMFQCNFKQVTNFQYTDGQQNTTAFEAVFYGVFSPLGQMVCIYDDNSCNILKSNQTEFIINSNTNLISGYYYFNQISPSANDIYNNSINSNPDSSCKIASGNQELLQLYCNNEQNPRAFNIISDPLALTKSSLNTDVPVFKLDNSNLYIKTVFMISSTDGKSTPGVLLNVITHPSNILHSFSSLQFPREFYNTTILFFVVNIILTFILIELGFWNKTGSRLSPKIISMIRGKIGTVLEITQFFDFGGNWYLELHGVYNYDFTSTRGVIHELLRERWRDTIFFPTALAASISILLITWIGGAGSVLMLIVIAGLLPFFLAFWIPNLWVIEDSGLKRVDYNDRGELLTIQKIAFIIRDGFNKLVGFGAIFGVGTAGASIARAQILQQNATLSSPFAGLESLLNFNFNFLVSAILWTLALLLLTTAVSLTGNILISLNYLNTGHLSNVKKFRNALLDKEIFMGTTQQVMDYAKKEESIYFDSKFDSTEELKQEIQDSPKNNSLNSESDQKDLGFESGENLHPDIINKESNDNKGKENNRSTESQAESANRDVY